MFTWRQKRQLSIAGTVLLAAGLIAAWIVIQPYITPTCSDNRKNQGEEDVDCGGGCIPCEVKRAKPAVVFWARGVEVRDRFFDVVAEVENPNETVSSARVMYEFLLFQGEQEVARREGTTFFFPQERRYIIETGISTAEKASRVEFRIVDAAWRLSSERRPDIIVERRELKTKEEDGLISTVVEADIGNRTSFDFRSMEVNYVVLDKEGNLLGANRVITDRILGGARETIRSSWPGLFSGTPIKIEVEPRINVYDPYVFMQPI